MRGKRNPCSPSSSWWSWWSWFGAVILTTTVSATEVTVPWRNWSTVGEASFSWTLFSLYDAELKSPNKIVKSHQQCAPCALRLTYHVDIKKKDFADRAQEEWIKQGVAQKIAAERANALKRILPDVNDGDTLTFVALKDRGIFFIGRRELGAISGQDFVSSFLSIWLGPKASYPEIRDELFGKPPSP